MAEDRFKAEAAFVQSIAESASRVVAAAIAANPGLAGSRYDVRRLIDDAVSGLSDRIDPTAPAKEEAPPAKPTPHIPVEQTITPDFIISLEDGKPYKSMKRHLSRMGLTPEGYRQKWGLPPEYPMVSANYSARRTELAKSQGLGKRD